MEREEEREGRTVDGCAGTRQKDIQGGRAKRERVTQ